ncbi:asparagine synthase C-terminal domain-containing protein [Halobacterium rubrum]|uniref:asparagine synthase C-terminal domain-containing protein n=1 Tax=Halobacterium TaxID=2239 RepID=UPI001F170FC7|nr:MULTISPECIES: asparagine synthetase B [Halobacterium]MDH5021085.1 asparagine synthetase B [Halobacterium rubrum]
MRNATPDVVAAAVESGDPLPGTGGFAGALPDGRLARDVLGRELCYVDGDEWSHDPGDLSDPTLLPAGHLREADATGGGQQVWSLPEPEPVLGDPVERVRNAVAGALDGVPTSGDDVAVAFSGGVDSALLAAKLDAPLYVVGYEGSSDIEAARESAAAMGRSDDLRVHEVRLDDIEAAVPEVARAIGRTNAMDVQIASPLYLVAERAAADGYDRLALGQGADELFGGYAKVAKAPEDPRTDADTVRGARRETVLSLPAQLERDLRALRAAGVEPVTPLLHDDVVRAALELPGEWLVSGNTRKRALREAARAWLPDVVADRDKKAVQYGSLVAREVDRLARQAGFKRRMVDHVTQYVEARLADDGGVD